MKTVNGIQLDDGVDEPGAYEWHDSLDEYQPYHFHPNNRPQDGRICQCEDAPCCGCYDL